MNTPRKNNQLPIPSIIVYFLFIFASLTFIFNTQAQIRYNKSQTEMNELRKLLIEIQINQLTPTP